jgi:hypothetical protein
MIQTKNESIARFSSSTSNALLAEGKVVLIIDIK